MVHHRLFQNNLEYIIEDFFTEILSSVDLGKDLLVGILSENDSILYLQHNSYLPAYLVAENFYSHFTQWKVALFDPGGKSIEQLTVKEKTFYWAIFIGIIMVMLIGIALMSYTVIRESEISRLKSEFVSNVSHELKTPLALIRMFGETLDSGIVGDEKAHDPYDSMLPSFHDSLFLLSLLVTGRKRASTEESSEHRKKAAIIK